MRLKRANTHHITRRAPRGARGLKSAYSLFACACFLASCPSRGTWIEIKSVFGYQEAWASCPSRGTWIEIVPGLVDHN